MAASPTSWCCAPISPTTDVPRALPEVALTLTAYDHPHLPVAGRAQSYIRAAGGPLYHVMLTLDDARRVIAASMPVSSTS